MINQKIVLLGCLFMIVLIMCGDQTSQVLAHRPFKSYVQQHSRITLKERYVDVTHHLSLADDFAYKARQIMDVDQNGQVETYEIEWFQANVYHLLPKGISLGYDGQWIGMTELYSPEIDLHGHYQVDETALDITCYFFAKYNKDPQKQPKPFLINNEFYVDVPTVWTWELSTEKLSDVVVNSGPVDERFQGGSMIVSETIASVSRTIYIEIKNNLSGEKK